MAVMSADAHEAVVEPANSARSGTISLGGVRTPFAQGPLGVRLAAMAAIVALAAAAIGGAAPFASALAVGILVPAAVIDIQIQRLPDVWVASAALVFVAALVVSAAAGHDVDLIGVLIGAASMSTPVVALHLVSPASMGFGDVKASALLGAALGAVDWRLGVVALCLAGLLGATFGLAARRRTIAFGPWLIGAALVCLVAHEPILDSLFTAGGAR